MNICRLVFIYRIGCASLVGGEENLVTNLSNLSAL